jgi:exosortase K
VKWKAGVLALAMAIAWLLKQHYADARADDVWWILAPTAKLAGLMTAVPFTWQPGEGYFSADRLFLIEKSCAGINFLIAAFGMLVFTLLHRVTAGGAALRVLGVSLFAAYGAAVTVNAIRIATALWLGAYPSVLTRLTAADVHRIEGVVVYFGGLVLLYELARRLDCLSPPVGSTVGADSRRAEITS